MFALDGSAACAGLVIHADMIRIVTEAAYAAAANQSAVGKVHGL